MKESKIIPEDITLFHIKTLEQHIEQLKENLFLNVAQSVMHNLQEEKIKLNLKINLDTCEEDDGKCPFAHFDIDFQFHIKNLGNFYTLNEKKRPIFDATLIMTLLGISFSTARGIIHEKLAAKNFHNIILPVISPQRILTDSIKAEDT